MKKLLPFLSILLFATLYSQAQITTVVIKANFGVDADLRANVENNVFKVNDDWFRKEAGPGNFVIDTTGAAYITSQYTSNPATRMQPFFRGMRFPQFSVVNNRLLIEAIFIRDHHGDDSTVFASGSNKNGMSPDLWSCPVSQGIPDKTDILDMMMHVRRDGPSNTDSLWMFGGVSLENTTGNRYFDFEMYQTDIYYDRTLRKFKNYGPDAGHTRWKFDAAGNIAQTGDIIFTAEYGSSTLTLLEARIWIDKSDLLITPTAFSWGGQFDGDGAGATYGYANIVPKTTGTFYTGTTSNKVEWAGDFKLVRQNNTVVNDYSANQFMEFSVNLTKLGLDPLTASGDPCKMPFRKILVKSRASTSFTAELKDFVGPFDFFRAPRALASADVPFFCGTAGSSNISVTNAVQTSLYKWSTTDGHIASDSIGPMITVDQPGSYVVSQELMDSCGSTYATDTVLITLDPSCHVLKTSLINFSASHFATGTNVSWNVTNNFSSLYYEVERSADNFAFTTIRKIWSDKDNDNFIYSYYDELAETSATTFYYRVKITDKTGFVTYSRIIAITQKEETISRVSLSPNPAQKQTQVVITTASDAYVLVDIFNTAGIKIHRINTMVKKGTIVFSLNDLQQWKPGIYIVKASVGNLIFTQKLIINR